jgi:hypothetical protein
MCVNDTFDEALLETFVYSTLGLEVPVLSTLLLHHASLLAK